MAAALQMNPHRMRRSPVRQGCRIRTEQESAQIQQGPTRVQSKIKNQKSKSNGFSSTSNGTLVDSNDKMSALTNDRANARTITEMGLAYVELTLGNARHPELQPLVIRALADTGSLLLCIPEHVAIQLRLEKFDEREVTIADGSRRICSYVGPLEVRFDGRRCYTGALILGEEVLLGSVPMDDMDLVISPAERRVMVNPNSPNIASSIVK